MNKSNPPEAVLYSSAPPSEAQRERFLAYLRKNYGEQVVLSWKKNAAIRNGFRMEIGSMIYDWTEEGRFSQFRHEMSLLGEKSGVIPLLKDTVQHWSPLAFPEERGVVLTVGDGIATVSGLDRVTYGEVLIFTGAVCGLVLELSEDRVGCILLGDDEKIASGSVVRRSGLAAGVPVGPGLLGRVVNALGAPIDGLGPIESTTFYPVERPAPAIIDRQPVDRPVETGIIAIDAMFPIGRGQRELIIGDRQTGKTAIALDTILNQKGKDVICIYVAIGQKNSSVAKIAEDLRKRGAMDYTVIVNAGASEPASFLYLAPYSGCTIGEYFMHQGKDVLIVYDDLSKHAVAYRTISLLLERSPGREAYPGDIFYLHSRLLERSAHLSVERGGGSMTALPIAETQAGDVSAYIPTNIISITDGQIFLESDLFFAGQRPAVNVGLSVSRVGSDAQHPAMKKASGPMRLNLAQYREMEIFTQFSSDLDDDTKAQLKYGAVLMAILRQKQYSPLKEHEQVILLLAALNGIFHRVDIDGVSVIAREMLDYFHEMKPDLCARIDATGDYSEAEKAEILGTAREFFEATGR